MSDPVHRGHVAAIRNRVASLNGAPGVELLGAVRRLFLRVPADRRRVEEDIRALQRGEASSLGIPLVPAHERPDSSHARVERAKPEVAGREIVFLVVGRVVRDVHLAVHARHPPIDVDRRGAVVVQSGSPALEDGRDDDHPRLLRRLPERVRARSGDRLGEIEHASVFGLGEVA